MAWKNCEKCGREIPPDSGVKHATFFESMFNKQHIFCCKGCKEAAIKDGDIKAHSNGCFVVVVIIIALICAASV